MNFNNILHKLSEYIWGNGLIFLLLLTGILYTLRSHFVQLRFIPFLIKSRNITHSDKNGKGISQMKTVCLSLGTAMGTGNITGVASALAIGGAGSVFWMWVSAFLGMALVYGENFLSAKYSRTDGLQGPMAYLKYGLGSKLLPYVFAFFCVAASLGMGGMVQVSSFSDSLYACGNFNPYIISAIIFTIIFLVIKGGVGRIGTVSQVLLPLAAISYTAVCLTVLFRFGNKVPQAFVQIFSQAFTFDSAAGGISGFAVSRAVSIGIRRGIFSNEAGLGSSPILHSASENSSPQLQGMWSVFEVFFDTIICCTLTAIVIITAGENFSIQYAFYTVIGKFSSFFLTVLMAVFAFCTVIGWYFCGETAFRCLFKGKNIIIFTLLFAAFSALGAIFTLDSVFALSDIFNGLMAIPNLLGLILLISKVKNE